MVNGVLPIWKEKGMTSHDVVAKVRKIVQTKKVGHTGTLDPEVDGVLPLCLNQATKIVEYMMDGDKTYVGEITLGFSTTTEDASGDRVDQKEVPAGALTEAQVDAAMEALTGTIIQVPPMYSAIKVKGKRLYEYARQGLEVERPQRQVKVYSFKRTSPLAYQEDGTLTFRFQVDCGRGTYVRTLAVELGKSLGFPAHMSDLTRTMSKGIQKEDCLTLSQLEEVMDQGLLADRVFSVAEVLADLPQVEISVEIMDQVRHGRVFDKEMFGPGQDFPLLLSYQGEAVALYNIFDKHPHLIKPERLFISNETPGGPYGNR